MSTFRGFVFENVVFPAKDLPQIIKHYGPRYLDDGEDRRDMTKAETVTEILDAIADSAGHNEDDVKTSVTTSGDLAFDWSRGTEEIDYTTSEDLTDLIDFATPGASVRVIDEEFQGGEYIKVKTDDGSAERHDPELLYPGLDSTMHIEWGLDPQDGTAAGVAADEDEARSWLSDYPGGKIVKRRVFVENWEDAA